MNWNNLIPWILIPLIGLLMWVIGWHQRPKDKERPAAPPEDDATIGLWRMREEKMRELKLENDFLRTSMHSMAGQLVKRCEELRLQNKANRRKSLRIKDQNRFLRGKQARIDELMFEYCPEEMTREQIDEWARHQRAVPDAEAKLIDQIVKKEITLEEDLAQSSYGVDTGVDVHALDELLMPVEQGKGHPVSLIFEPGQLTYEDYVQRLNLRGWSTWAQQHENTKRAWQLAEEGGFKSPYEAARAQGQVSAEDHNVVATAPPPVAPPPSA